MGRCAMVMLLGASWMVAATPLRSQVEDEAALPYVLLPDSVVSFNCPCCELIHVGGPVTGGFQLTRVVGEGVLAEQFLVQRLELVVGGQPTPLVLSGSGTYQRQGGAEPREVMDLEILHQEGFSYGTSTTGIVEPFATFPAITVRLASPDDGCGLFYVLTLVAEPGSPMRFRRGDTNADGQVDVADAIAALRWLFQGEAAPSCLASADSNADGAHDLSDAVHLLLHLFAAGAAPPWPGPAQCGSAAPPGEECATYGACG